LNFSPTYSARNGYSNDKSLLASPPEVSARAAAYQAAQDEIVKRLLDAAGRVADLQHEMKKVQALHDAAVAEMTAAQESLRGLEQQMIEESRSMSK
jgi:hypothetical protein